MVTPSKITTRTKKMTMKTLIAPKKNILFWSNIYEPIYLFFI